MTDDEGRDLEHAWRYFALHAQQRMTVFNFFVASAGAALTGLAWTLANGSTRWPLGAAAGIGAAALSFVFWRLDQRGAQLVKSAEYALVAIEAGLTPSAGVTAAERKLPTNAGWTALATPWTFGRSFRLLFAAVAFLGIAGAAATILLGTSEAELARWGNQTAVQRTSQSRATTHALSKPVAFAPQPSPGVVEPVSPHKATPGCPATCPQPVSQPIRVDGTPTRPTP